MFFFRSPFPVPRSPFSIPRPKGISPFPSWATHKTIPRTV
jgi:hypothetical protein